MVFPLFLCHFVGEALLDQEIQETRSTQSLGQPEMRPWRLSWRVYRFKKPQWQETTPPNKQIYKQYIIPQQKLKIYKFYVVKTKNQQAHSWWFIPPINMVNWLPGDVPNSRRPWLIQRQGHWDLRAWHAWRRTGPPGLEKMVHSYATCWENIWKNDGKWWNMDRKCMENEWKWWNMMEHV